MAIRKNKTVVPTKEAVDNSAADAVETAPVEEKVEAPVEEKVEAPVEEKVEAPVEEKKAEVVVRKQAAAPAVAVEEAPSLISLRDAFPGNEFGTAIPRLVPASGKVKIAGTTTMLGTFIDIQVISVSDRWMVTPVADQKDKEARKFCRASFDGSTIPDRDGGASMTIDEYTKSVDEYEEFDVKKYLDIFAIIIRSGDEVFQEKVEQMGIVQISCSPTTIAPYTAFEKQTPLMLARGMMVKSHQNCIRLNATAKSNESSDWSVFEFNVVPLKDLEGYTPISL